MLDRDIMKVPADEILDTKVVATYVGGRAVYEASAPPTASSAQGARR